MDQSLTVVLPMHNCERQLRSSVQDILDLVPSISRPVAVVIVDDGSTDDTFETACELARSYPQVTVLRQAMRQGLGSILELVRNRLALDLVVVHDGVSAINVAELKGLLQIPPTNGSQVEKAVPPSTSNLKSSGSRRFAAVRALHDRLEQVHRSATSFRWMQLERPLVPRRSPAGAPVATLGSVPAIGAPTQLASLPVGSHSLT